jgi:outer membrane protein OmpU
MNHRLLLGSTALAGAGMLFASAASAQEAEVAGLQVILGGFTEWGINAANHDTLDNNNHNRGYAFYMDNEIIVRAEGVTDGGIRYGSKVEIEVASDLDVESANAVSADEVGLFFSGGFGRVELGREDGAEDVMFVGAEDAQAGTGGIDGDTQNLGQVQFPDMSDDVKATYFTPRIAGFQLGASFAPDGDDNGNGLGSNEFISSADGGVGDNRENMIGGGANWVGVLGPVDLTLSAVGMYADVKGGDATQAANGFQNDEKAWAIGGLLGFGGLSFGVSFNDFEGPTDADKGQLVSFGLTYGFGPANVSVGYEHDWNDNIDNADVFVVSGDLGVLPGVTLKADVSYNTEDEFKRVEEQADGTTTTNSGGTIAGVVAVQLDY